MESATALMAALMSAGPSALRGLHHVPECLAVEAERPEGGGHVLGGGLGLGVGVEERGLDLFQREHVDAGHDAKAELIHPAGCRREGGVDRAGLPRGVGGLGVFDGRAVSGREAAGWADRRRRTGDRIGFVFFAHGSARGMEY
ncbi:MAG: hypothetical protein NTY01_08445 [Verrucomicrobia bacterium]|nr:hypothetical protein [Verrucomicrobiota bacterium]